MPLSDAWIDFVAGWCSGAVAVVVLQPMDTILTRWQATRPQVVPVQNATTTTTAAAATTTTTLLSNANTAIKNNVLSKHGLWRGSWAMMGAVPVQNALLMGGYGIGQQWVSGTNGTDGNKDSSSSDYRTRCMAIFVGGTTGGILQSFLMSPVELIKVQQQLQPPTTTADRTTTTTILRQLATTPMRGLTATLWRDGIPHGVWFVTYDILKEYLQTYDSSENTNNNVLIPLTAGAGAATIAWLVGYPADLIKTRIQAPLVAAGTTETIGFFATGKQLLQEANGSIVRGLYRGLSLKLLRAIPASMIGFSVYEAVKHPLEQWNV
jgi:solute carrier family 25 carnitine/acylcarnitine transporter 20/29